MARGGAYLDKRLLTADFLRAVRRRMQGRDPLTGILESELFGAAPRVKGQPRLVTRTGSNAGTRNSSLPCASTLSAAFAQASPPSTARLRPRLPLPA
jgi:hypothetical protein